MPPARDGSGRSSTRPTRPSTPRRRVKGPDGKTVEGLRWFSIRQRVLLSSPPADDDPDYRDGWVLPVLTQVGLDADDDSRDDTCPSCQQKDGIRFLGSAIATLLSVTLSTMFGDEALDPREKKALVFTDSVQDAAHRAGFVESRSHTLTLRALLRHAVGDQPVSLDVLVDRAIAEAGDDQFRRYRIIPPDLVERNEFAPFWQRDRARDIPARVRTRVRRRLLFDAVLEFGLQSRVGRTLEQTGSAVVEVDAGEPSALARMAREVLDATEVPDTLDNDLRNLADSRLVAWVRGVVERMRTQGAIEHEWFQSFIRHDGNRYFIWGGRPRGQGMPAFPRGRAAPAFPRIGPAAKVKDPLLDPVSSPQSWYARWTQRVLGVPAGHGARLARQLLERLARADVLHTVATEGGGTVFTIPASAVVVSPAWPDEMAAGDNLLTCNVCRTEQPGTATVVAQLDGAPCMLVRCPGTLHREPRADNYYRRLYASTDMRRIVAREHTSLVPDADPAAVRERVQAVGQRPERAERARRHAHPGDGHRHRRPVRRAARVAAQDGRLLPAAGRPGRAPDRQRARPRLRHRPRRATRRASRTRCRSSTGRSARRPRTCPPRRSCGGSTSPTSSTASPARRTGRTRAWRAARSGRPTRGRSSGS